MRERLANTAETTTQSDAGSIVEGSNEACNVELDSSVTARRLRHALTLVYTGRVKVPQEDVPELSAAALALGLKVVMLSVNVLLLSSSTHQPSMHVYQSSSSHLRPTPT